MYPLIWEWREARKPIPVSVKIIDDRFYVLLSNTYHIHFFNDIFRKATIYCNEDIPGAKVMGHKCNRIVESMVVECPVDLNPARTKFEKLTILTNANGASSNESLNQNNDTYIYPENMLRKMDECERLDMLQESERNVKTAATVAFRGGIKKGQTAQFSSWKSVRRQALEWAEYHHLIGIDHMWIYVNEAWDNGVDLPYRDYITWIPFDLNVYNYDAFTKFPGDTMYMDLFRVVSQTDALWRARREGVDWLLLTDVDEYVRIGPETNDGSSPAIGSFSRFMRNFTDSHKDNIGVVAGIRLRSMFYGRNTQVDRDEDIDLEIDNVWTQPWDQSFSIRFRNKLILDPKIAMGSRLHRMTVSAVAKFDKKTHNGLVDVSQELIRVNHYTKQPHKGVSRRKAQGKGKVQVGKLVKETYLRDNFRDLLLSAVEKNSSLDW
eukprot:CAMPEP_0116131420 /NCGR_PEP_ID=MMETSP0329-20121206/8995_1 /TAXON_ID=697910 /ORGANISM="Pseudo-nitzschia arenysensis, Strain B593" /LENGTH=434 /DNA_ID=CAMNT_0003625847 /DNA_START=361 /DNA_END=1662 /DNA_ORIENTATION=-